MCKLLIIFLIIILLLILFGPIKIQNRILEMMYPREYENFVSLSSKEYNVDENLVYA